VERVVRVFEHFEDAEAADLADWLALSGEDRLRIGEEMSREAFADGAATLVRCVSMRALAADDE
jgi:hypothetical protein